MGDEYRQRWPIGTDGRGTQVLGNNEERGKRHEEREKRKEEGGTRRKGEEERGTRAKNNCILCLIKT
jgi:hypothetical protein